VNPDPDGKLIEMGEILNEMKHNSHNNDNLKKKKKIQQRVRARKVNECE